MKNRNILILLVVISIFSGFFGACENSNTPAGPTCTVSFEANGGTPAPKPIIVKQGGIVKAPANMTKTGFYFWGWYTESACINQWSFKGNIVTDDMTLYAKWDGNVPPAVFTVTFVANSGIPAPVTQTVTQGGKIIPPAYMTRTGYSFSGWYMDAAFTIPWNFTGDTVTGNVTLQAKWTKTDLITDINQLGPYIIQQTDGNSPDNPVNLTISIDLTPMTDSNSGWQKILTAIQWAGKYVNLDLTACTMGTVFNPEFNPDASVSMGKDKIVTLILPNDIVGIPDSNANNVFSYFTNLRTIISSSCLKIGDFAFYNCTNLINADFPQVRIIGEKAFFFDIHSNLVSVNIPLVTSIGDNAFGGCTSLASINFPLVTSIGNNAFYGCTGLTSVSFPLITSIGNIAFGECSRLASVSFPLITAIGNFVFAYCTSLVTVDIPLVTNIGTYAFDGCTSLTSVDFPLTTNIGFYAFDGCTSLASVNLPLVTDLSLNTFSGFTSLASVNLPLVTDLRPNTFSGCTSLTNINIQSVTNIGQSAFANTDSISLTITMGPGSTNFYQPTYLGGSLFSGVIAPKTVTIKIPANSSGYVPDGISLPATYSGDDRTVCWGNGFRGAGWDGTGFIYGSEYIQSNITLHIVQE